MSDPTPEKVNKSTHAEREERILSYWKKKGIFEKTLEKNKDSGKEFIFYEGPPTANGRPGIHHMEARAFKDSMPRYKTMQGFHVRRKGGWDTHGLPVELQVEKELGLKSKKEIEIYGIAAFNEKCKESVWKYVHEWEDFTNRIGYWVDLKNPYITYKPQYIESLWNIVKHVDDRKLLYKDYKVIPWCPRCGTGLSSHELGQPDAYQMDKDLSVTAKFKVIGKEKTYILAWTTTPWTLPGNVALAVGEKIDYVKVKVGEDILILAKARVESVLKDQQYEIVGELKGSELVGWEYEPLYPFMKDAYAAKDPEAFQKAYKVYAADFVTTEDGTGVVHTAVMYGQDDFELGNKLGLPKFHLVNDDGTFKAETGTTFAGRFVKDEEVAVDIIKDLANRPTGSLLFKKEKYEHSYPHCWRCKTPLIYYARDSWYIRMSSLRDELVKENKKINWEPSYIKEGRFGEWLSEIKDWAVSRERYWGTPLPVWNCEKCGERKVVGSVEEIAEKPRNEYWVMRHGKAEHNIPLVLNSDPSKTSHLIEEGKKQVLESARAFKQKVDIVYTSPFMRTKETAEIVKKELGLEEHQIIADERLRELTVGESWEGRTIEDFVKAFPFEKRFEHAPEGGEKYGEVKKRVGDFLYEIESKHEGKKILIITHGAPAMMLLAAAHGADRKGSIALEVNEYISNAEIRKIDFEKIPHNPEYELDLHRPYIDEVKLTCSCGGTMSRVKEVMDVWFDSGAMPFAQDHYPFENKEVINGSGLLKRHKGYPADFISEAIDQTRGWFYTLHAIGLLMGKGHAYKNVVCLGHILDAKGKKMSKSIGNVVDPWTTMEKFGADAVRYWMYSVNQPGESKNFDEKTVDEVVKKVFNLVTNVTSFYKMYAKVGGTKEVQLGLCKNALDQWIMARMDQLIREVTLSLETYRFLEATRAIRGFVADLSQWYIRRSRDRFKEDGRDKDEALAVTEFVLLELSKVLAPFTPFFAEYIYKELGGELESVHLESWPLDMIEAGGEKYRQHTEEITGDMESLRSLASHGLEARTNAKINVRQPLATLRVKDGRWMLKNKANRKALLDIIKDEVNVKSVIFVKDLANDVELDTTITPELKEEGDLRELLRKIQDMRKEKGLSVGDKAILIVGEDMRSLVSKNEEQIKKVTNLSKIEFGAAFELKV
jgi:isoleucyl-tRNA synthetase